MNSLHDDDDEAHFTTAKEVGALMPAVLVEAIERVGTCHSCTTLEAAAHILGTYMYAAQHELTEEYMEAFLADMLKKAEAIRKGLVESHGETTLSVPPAIKRPTSRTNPDVNNMMDAIFEGIGLGEDD